MQKRGQITIFILLLLVALIAFSLITYIRVSKIEEIVVETKRVTSDVSFAEPVKNFVENCLNIVSEEAIEILGWQGGHIVPPNDSIITFFSVVSLGYDEGKNELSTKKQMEDEISLYVDFGLESCLNNFSSFEGYDITTLDINTQIIIRDDSILVQTYYPIQIQKDNKKFQISNFRTTIPVRLGYIRDSLDQIIVEQQQDQGWIPVTSMSEFDMLVNIYPQNETNLLYEIIDPLSRIDNEPFTFLTANKFKK